MRKTKKVTKTVTTLETLDILCNMCGKSLSNNRRNGVSKKEMPFPLCDHNGLVEVEVTGGYESEVIGDQVSWRFSICEHCLGKIAKKFVIPVEKKDHDTDKEFK